MQRLPELPLGTIEFPIVLSTAFLIFIILMIAKKMPTTFYVMKEIYMGMLILDASRYSRIQRFDVPVF